MAELILSVAVESIETKRKGYLKLHRHSDVVYSILYHDSYEYINADIDSVQIEVKNRLVRFHIDEEDYRLQCSFRVVNRRHLQMLFDAQMQCQEVCNLTLELSSRIRDVYYAGLCASGCLIDDASLSSEEALQLQNNALERTIRTTKLAFDIWPYYSTGTRKISHNMISSGTVGLVAINGTGSVFTSADSQPALPNLSNLPVTAVQVNQSTCVNRKQVELVKCFYCEEKSCDNSQRKFYIHPYVPLTFDRKPMIMCSICIENWNDYRERAELDCQLILPNEINEELCCLCSDTPEELILCSTCQRSFCDGCLQKTVTDRKVYQGIIAKSDWKCFSCVNRVTLKPILSKEAWKFWNSPHVTHQQGLHGQLSFEQLTASPSENRISPFRPSRSIVSKSAIMDKRVRAIQNVENTNKQHSIKVVKDSVAASVVASEKISPFRVLDPPTLIGTQAGNSTYLEGASNRKGSSVDLNENSTKDIAGRQNGPKILEITVNNAASSTLDEVYYFSQYVANLEESYRQLDELIVTGSRSGKPNKKLHAFPTDEVCFLCKDGGDLIECDYCSQKSKHSLRCFKVYHSYCLDFQVEDDVEWLCPRHFCSCCGSKQLKYMCMFCPISVCPDCPQNLVKTVSMLSSTAIIMIISR